jgi:hypothetical protein
LARLDSGHFGAVARLAKQLKVRRNVCAAAGSGHDVVEFHLADGEGLATTVALSALLVVQEQFDNAGAIERLHGFGVLLACGFAALAAALRRYKPAFWTS